MPTDWIPALLNWPVAVAAGLFVLAILIFVALRGLQKRNDPLPYRLVASILTPTEAAFHPFLLSALTGLPVVVLAKVRMEDLLDIPRGTAERERHRGRVKSRHVDFLICQAQTLKPLMAIELDDPSHRRADVIKRDAFVDLVMETIGLPIWHVPTAKTYEPAALRAGILARLSRFEK